MLSTCCHLITDASPNSERDTDEVKKYLDEHLSGDFCVAAEDDNLKMKYQLRDKGLACKGFEYCSRAVKGTVDIGGYGFGTCKLTWWFILILVVLALLGIFGIVAIVWCCLCRR